MAYQTKIKKKKKITPIEREFRTFRKETKGKLPPRETYREASRIAFRVPQRVYKKGTVIRYKGEPYHINRVTQKGIHISQLKEGEKGFAVLSKKEEFVSNKRIYEGEVYPFYPYVYFGLI